MIIIAVMKVRKICLVMFVRAPRERLRGILKLLIWALFLILITYFSVLIRGYRKGGGHETYGATHTRKAISTGERGCVCVIVDYHDDEDDDIVG